MIKIITDDLIEKYKDFLINEEKASATLEKYIRDIKAFFEWISGTEIDKQKVLNYKEYLIKMEMERSYGGIVEGANKSVWMQDPSKNANTGKLTITEDATLIHQRTLMQVVHITSI